MPAYPTHPQRRKPKQPVRDTERHTLVKYLVGAGLGSRRHCAALVMAGYVSVNDEVASSLTMEVSFRDKIDVDGRPVQAKRGSYVYLAAHKPDGYLSTVSDDRERETVLDLVPRALRVNGLVPAGRLDLHSTGLMLLTNDGELVNRITHPRYEVEKEYHVSLDRVVQPSASSKLRTGVEIESGTARAKALRRLQDEPGYRYSVTLNEGKKREVRLMFREVGRAVEELERVRIGSLTLGTLAPGGVRELTDREVSDLKRLVGIYAPREETASAGAPGAASPGSRPRHGRPPQPRASGERPAGRERPSAAGERPSNERRPRPGAASRERPSTGSGPSTAARERPTTARERPRTATRSGRSTGSARTGGERPAPASRERPTAAPRQRPSTGSAPSTGPRSERSSPQGQRTTKQAVPRPTREGSSGERRGRPATVSGERPSAAPRNRPAPAPRERSAPASRQGPSAGSGRSAGARAGKQAAPRPARERSSDERRSRPPAASSRERPSAGAGPPTGSGRASAGKRGTAKRSGPRPARKGGRR